MRNPWRNSWVLIVKVRFYQFWGKYHGNIIVIIGGFFGFHGNIMVILAPGGLVGQ